MIKTLWYINSIECYAAIKKDDYEGDLEAKAMFVVWWKVKKKKQEINSTNTVITTLKNMLACGPEIQTVAIKMLELWVGFFFFPKILFNAGGFFIYT